MGNIYNSLPRFTVQGKALEEESYEHTTTMMVAGNVSSAIGDVSLSAAAADVLNEIAATQPELTAELARFVAENFTDPREQLSAITTGVKAARLIASQISIEAQEGPESEPDFEID